MAFKLVAFAALVAAANAGLVAPAYQTYQAAPAYQSYQAAPAYQSYQAAPAVAHYAPAPLAYAAPVAKAVVKTIDADYDPNPQYSYSYDVQDSLTGDNKQQQESRNGDAVQGSYSLIEADGTRRIVEYTADPVNGFNAVVHKEPAAVAVKAVAAAPAAYAYAAPAHPAPLAYSPVAKVASYAAPAYYH